MILSSLIDPRSEIFRLDLAVIAVFITFWAWLGAEDSSTFEGKCQILNKPVIWKAIDPSDCIQNASKCSLLKMYPSVVDSIEVRVDYFEKKKDVFKALKGRFDQPKELHVWGKALLDFQSTIELRGAGGGLLPRVKREVIRCVDPNEDDFETVNAMFLNSGLLDNSLGYLNSMTFSKDDSLQFTINGDWYCAESDFEMGWIKSCISAQKSEAFLKVASESSYKKVQSDFAQLSMSRGRLSTVYYGEGYMVVSWGALDLDFHKKTAQELVWRYRILNK